MLPIPYARHRSLPVIIQHAIWLYLRITLSYHDVEYLLAECGVEVKHGIVQPFPSKKNLIWHISPNALVRYAPVAPGDVPEDWDKGSVLVLRTGEISRPFQAALPLPPLDTGEDAIARDVQRRLHEATGPDGAVTAWLLGSITYQSTFGGQHWTNFYIRARQDGGASAWDEHPYAERI